MERIPYDNARSMKIDALQIKRMIAERKHGRITHWKLFVLLIYDVVNDVQYKSLKRDALNQSKRASSSMTTIDRHWLLAKFASEPECDENFHGSEHAQTHK